MSLKRQLVWLLSLLFFLVFGGTLIISVNNARSYLNEQLDIHARAMAASLGPSLAPAMARHDLAAIESVADAVTAHGYYRLHIQGADGKTLVERNLPLKVANVPLWFTHWIPLDVPEHEVQITAAGQPAGSALVSSNPGQAYRELWRIARSTLCWFAAAWLAAILLIITILRFALAPLRAMENQALAISAGEIPALIKQPWTREFRQVATALNKMSEKIEGMLSDKVALMKKIEQDTYRDPVTGLGNRAQFDTRMHYLLNTPEEFPGGALLLVRLARFQEYNGRHGRKAGDELLRQVAEALGGLCEDMAQPILSRFSGAEFALLAPGISLEEAATLGEKIRQALGDLHSRRIIDAHDVGHIGIAYANGHSLSVLYAEADMALRAAQSKGPNAYYLYGRGMLQQEQRHGADHWRKLLEYIVAQREVTLYAQPVIAQNDHAVLHHEVLARIPGTNGDVVAAGVFMPMAERLGLASEIDKLVVSELLPLIADKPECYAINISAVSLRDLAFWDWLYRKLGANPEAASRIILEVPEYACAQRPQLLHDFISAFSPAGCQFSLDRFGINPGSFGYLRGLHLDCIKIDGSYTRELDSHKDNQFYLQTLKEIAHGLDTRIIATSVETEAELNCVRALGFDGAQGDYLGKLSLISA